MNIPDMPILVDKLWWERHLLSD